MNSNEYAAQEKQISEQSERFLALLKQRGLVGDETIHDAKIREVRREKQKKAYHNTLLLLQRYRDIAWSLQCFPNELAEELDAPFNGLDTLLDSINTQIALDNVKLENRMKSVQRSRLLLDRVNEALNVLKIKPGDGELLYDVIYQTYISADKKSLVEILDALNLTQRTYYRYRPKAISIISIKLWSVPSMELDTWLDVLTLFESFVK